MAVQGLAHYSFSFVEFLPEQGLQIGPEGDLFGALPRRAVLDVVAGGEAPVQGGLAVPAEVANPYLVAALVESGGEVVNAVPVRRRPAARREIAAFEHPAHFVEAGLVAGITALAALWRAVGTEVRLPD